MIPKRMMKPPTIQQFHAFPFVYAPYTHGETNNHTPASRHIVLIAFAAPSALPELTAMLPVLVCSFDVIYSFLS
jgi:hypothetical protein